MKTFRPAKAARRPWGSRFTIRELQGHSQNDLARLTGILRQPSAIENDRPAASSEPNLARAPGAIRRSWPSRWEVARDSAA
jgi:hypothetical protein